VGMEAEGALGSHEDRERKKRKKLEKKGQFRGEGRGPSQESQENYLKKEGGLGAKGCRQNNARLKKGAIRKNTI